MKRPLEGIKIIDLGHVLAAPYCTMVLADLGAEVIKIERPGVGDDTRRFSPYINGESAYFNSINRDKESMTLNLKNPKGKEIFLELVKKGDVITENYRPDTMDKLGLGYEELKKINPKIIYACITGFGHDTVYPGRPGYDIIAQAAGGLMSITGYPDKPPTRVGSSIGDIISGLFTVIGILSALRARETTGKGQKIDIAMTDCVMAVLENAFARYTATGEVPERIGSRHPSLAPFDVFKTKDGWMVIGVGNDSLWAKFCKGLNIEEYITDPKYATNEARSNHSDELKTYIEKWTSARTTDKAVEEISSFGVPCGPVNTVDKVMEDANTKLRNMVVDLPHPTVGKMTFVNNPIKLSETPCDIFKAAPGLGEDTDKVLKRILGYSEEKIEALRKEGII
ncbi:MAG: CaiB/BaiF CoA transferase family protein [Candidatus Methanofastidiosia archaeon]